MEMQDNTFALKTDTKTTTKTKAKQDERSSRTISSTSDSISQIHSSVAFMSQPSGRV
jgi:hypothetical protein